MSQKQGGGITLLTFSLLVAVEFGEFILLFLHILQASPHLLGSETYFYVTVKRESSIVSIKSKHMRLKRNAFYLFNTKQHAHLWRYVHHYALNKVTNGQTLRQITKYYNKKMVKYVNSHGLHVSAQIHGDPGTRLIRTSPFVLRKSQQITSKQHKEMRTISFV